MKPANLFDPPGHSDDASSFRAGLDEIRSSSDVDVGEYFDGSDALPKRAKGRIVDVVGDSDSLSGADAADARDALRNLDEASDADITHFIDRGDTSAVKYLSETDQGEIDNMFSLDVDTSGHDIDTNLAREVRTGLAKSYGFNKLDSDEIAEVIDDIETLQASDHIEGLPRVLRDGFNKVTGNRDIVTRVKGATYEMRIAKHLTSRESELDLEPGERIRLGYEPDKDGSTVDVNFGDLEDGSDGPSDDIEYLAERVYGSTDEESINNVRSALNLDSSSDGPPEFDGYLVRNDGDVTYFEMKNWQDGSADPSDIKQKTTRFLAYQKLRGGNPRKI